MVQFLFIITVAEIGEGRPVVLGLWRCQFGCELLGNGTAVVIPCGCVLLVVLVVVAAVVVVVASCIECRVVFLVNAISLAPC